MGRPQKIGLAIGAVGLLVLSATLIYRLDLLAQVFPRNPELDRSKPVPSKDEIIAAWRKRQDAIRTFRFAWTEQQVHPKGWIPNPRYPQREWMDIPNLATDRNYTVTKTLAVDGSKMRYSYELDRKDDPDDFRNSIAPDQIARLGDGKHYVYTSTFDGQVSKIRLVSRKDSPAPTTIQSTSNVDAQTMDTRAILMTYRPLDPVMGHVLIDRAVTNQMRSIHRGKSTFLLEEQRDPSGWKSIFRIEPERAFLIDQIIVPFEHKPTLEIDIDYIEDAKWGWVPSAWRITQLLADGTKRQVADAKVTSYSFNEPVAAEEFKQD